MSGIIVRFETKEPVIFQEKGFDTEFKANVSGALYIDDYDENAYGANENERRQNLGKWALGKVSEHLSRWSEKEEGLYLSGNGILESLLREDMNAEGLMGSARVDTIKISDDTNEKYQELILKPAREAKQEAFQKKMEAAQEPHGPLMEVSYNRSSHGMMAGTGSSITKTLRWKGDGSVILSSNILSGGKNFHSDYKVKPEIAQKVRDFVTDSKLAALANLRLETPMMYDNFTSASISMTYDDSSIGGDAFNMCCLMCGPYGLTYASIEKEIDALLEECEKTGECIKNQMYDSTQGFTGMFFGMGMMNMVQTGNPLAPKGTQETGTKWICSCGTENGGRFCTECGKPRP